jgi:hypothetical protein
LALMLARLLSVHAAAVFPATSPHRSSSTSGATAPAFTIFALLASLLYARSILQLPRRRSLPRRVAAPQQLHQRRIVAGRH